MTRTSKTLLSLIYFIPALLAASFIAWNFQNPIAEGILALGILTLTVLFFIGAICHIKNGDESTKTYAEILVVFTVIILSAELFFGMLLLWQTGSNQPFYLGRIPFWPTLLYIILIAAPITTVILKKSASPSRSAARSLSAFTVGGIIFIILYTVRSVLGDAHDVVGGASGIGQILLILVYAGFIIWAALGILGGVMHLTGRKKEVSES